MIRLKIARDKWMFALEEIQKREREKESSSRSAGGVGGQQVPNRKEATTEHKKLSSLMQCIKRTLSSTVYCLHGPQSQ